MGNSFKNLSSTELASRLRQANLAYREGHPYLSDRQFDEMEEYLRSISPNDPYFDEVGHKPIEANFKHSIPMLSQQKCLTDNELFSFLRFMRSKGWSDFVASAKMDGMSASCHYLEGRLTNIVSRGDGENGIDYTEKLSCLAPASLGIPFTGEIRGELVMSWKSFEALKAICARNGEKEPTHPRNSVVGIISAQSSKEKVRLIDFVAWQLIDKNASKGKDPWGQYDENTWTNDMQFVKELGFSVVPSSGLYLSQANAANDVKAIISSYQAYKDNRATSYPIDGIIFRIDSNDDYEDCGYTAHHPKGAAAYKFAAEEAVVTIKDIEWSVGSTGEVTPIALFDKVKLAGADVGRASLHNIRFMIDLGLKVGASATVIRSGEVIPRIIGNPGQFATMQQILASVPYLCPVCGARLSFDADYTHAICDNEECQGKLARKLELFCKALDMDNFGPANCQLIAPRITHLYDIFNLSAEDFRKAGIGYAMSSKLCAEIHKKASFPMHQFLNALCIPQLGPGTAKELEFAFKTIDALLQASYAVLLNRVDRLGELSARVLYDGLRKAQPFITELSKYISVDAPHTQASSLYDGLTIAVTGFLSRMSRDKFSKHIQANGGRYATSVSKNTSILICNQPSSSSKAQKAAKLGVKVMTEEEFYSTYTQN